MCLRAQFIKRISEVKSVSDHNHEPDHFAIEAVKVKHEIKTCIAESCGTTGQIVTDKPSNYSKEKEPLSQPVDLSGNVSQQFMTRSGREDKPLRALSKMVKNLWKVTIHKKDMEAAKSKPDTGTNFPLYSWELTPDFKDSSKANISQPDKKEAVADLTEKYTEGRSCDKIKKQQIQTERKPCNLINLSHTTNTHKTQGSSTATDTDPIQEEGTETTVQEEAGTTVIVGKTDGKSFVGEQGACNNQLSPIHKEVTTKSVHNEGLCQGFCKKDGINKDCSPRDLIMQESSQEKKVIQAEGMFRDKPYEKDATKGFPQEFRKKMQLKQPYEKKGLEKLGNELLIEEKMMQQPMEDVKRPIDSTDETYAKGPVGENIIGSDEKPLEQTVLAVELVREEEKTTEQELHGKKIPNEDLNNNSEDKDCFKVYSESINCLKTGEGIKEVNIEDLKDKERCKSNIDEHKTDPLKLANLNCSETYGSLFSTFHVNICMEGNQGNPNEEENDYREDEDETEISVSQDREMSIQQQRLYNNLGLTRARTISLRALRSQPEGQLIDLHEARLASLQNGQMVDIHQMNHGGPNDQQSVRLASQLGNEPMVDTYQTNVLDSCSQCGFSPARVWCTDCNNRFCVNCDARFHGYHDTRAHRRLWC